MKNAKLVNKLLDYTGTLSPFVATCQSVTGPDPEPLEIQRGCPSTRNSPKRINKVSIITIINAVLCYFKITPHHGTLF